MTQRKRKVDTFLERHLRGLAREIAACDPAVITELGLLREVERVVPDAGEPTFLDDRERMFVEWAARFAQQCIERWSR